MTVKQTHEPPPIGTAYYGPMGRPATIDWHECAFPWRAGGSINAIVMQWNEATHEARAFAVGNDGIRVEIKPPWRADVAALLPGAGHDWLPYTEAGPGDPNFRDPHQSDQRVGE